MKGIFKYLPLLATLLFAGCNNDIFMDDPGIPQISDVSVKGDDGVWSCAIPVIDLQGIFVNYPSQEKQYVQFISSDRTQIPDASPGDPVAEILYYSPLSSYSISLSDSMLYIQSYYSSVTSGFTITLYYSNGLTGYIHVTLQQGEPLVFLYEERTGDLEIATEPAPTVFSQTLVNNTSLSQTLTIQPFKNSESFFRVTPSERWAQDMTVDIGVPAFDGKDWFFSYRHDVVLGRIYDFIPEELYTEQTLTVEVPPQKKASVRVSVTYQRARQNARMIFHNNFTKLNWEAECEMVARYPVSYEYEVHFE